MFVENLLSDEIRTWVARQLPGDQAAADGAVRVALTTYAHTASVSRACTEVLDFVGSWVRHPSHHYVGSPSGTRLAS